MPQEELESIHHSSMTLHNRLKTGLEQNGSVQANGFHAFEGTLPDGREVHVYQDMTAKMHKDFPTEQIGPRPTDPDKAAQKFDAGYNFKGEPIISIVVSPNIDHDKYQNYVLFRFGDLEESHDTDLRAQYYGDRLKTAAMEQVGGAPDPDTFFVVEDPISTETEGHESPMIPVDPEKDVTLSQIVNLVETTPIRT